MENNVRKEKAGKSRYSRTERNSMSQSRKTKDESEVKIVESSKKSPRRPQVQRPLIVAKEPVKAKEKILPNTRKRRERK